VLASDWHVKSVRAELKIVLVHKLGYFLRFLLRKRKGNDRSPEFPLVGDDKYPGWSVLLVSDLTKSTV